MTDTQQRFLQEDLQEYVTRELGVAQWVPILRFSHAPEQHVGFFAALVPARMVKAAMQHVGWDVHDNGFGLPGIITRYKRGKGQDSYFRFGNDDGAEPLVIRRSFHGLREPQFELNEEFRLYHNLYYEPAKKVFIKFTGNGDEEEVVRMSENNVEARLWELKEFMSVKGLHLALFFQLDRFSDISLAEMGLTESDNLRRDEGLIYSLNLRDTHGLLPHKSMSVLVGKKILAPEPWNPLREEPRPTEQFIIGVDKHGVPVLHCCDPDKLADYFGKNPEAPHYLTAVFFRREVLQKYYARPEKYKVEDGHIHCGNLWVMRIDNDHPKHVIAYLGDLGRDLSSAERGYWKSFNIVPDGTISEVQFRRGFLAGFADPESPDLVFKSAYKQFNKAWSKKCGWPLFRPLPNGDEHLLTTLRIPLTDDQAEFDGQVMALAKILVDSLNEDELAKTGIPLTKDMRGISKLAAYLDLKSFAEKDEAIGFLRDLYDLRSTGSGHRKGKSYKKAAAGFRLDELGLSRAFAMILTQATEVLNRLQTLAQ